MVNHAVQGLALVVLAVFLGIGIVWGVQRATGDDAGTVDCAHEEGLPGEAWGKLYFRDRVPGSNDFTDWRFIGYCNRDGKLI